MKIQIGSGSSFIKPKKIVCEKDEVTIDLPPDPSNYVVVDNIGLPYPEFLHKIKSLVLKPYHLLHPQFRVRFEDGRSIIIDIDTEININCYGEQPLSKPEQSHKIPLPKKKKV